MKRTCQRRTFSMKRKSFENGKNGSRGVKGNRLQYAMIFGISQEANLIMGLVRGGLYYVIIQRMPKMKVVILHFSCAKSWRGYGPFRNEDHLCITC